MKRVLWISRHQMTPFQRQDLETALGDRVELLPWTDTVDTAEELLPALAQADAVAAVLPIQLMAQLWSLCGEKPLLQAVARRTATGVFRTLPDGRREQEFRFVHGGWQQICRLELETKLLSGGEPPAPPL